METAASRLSSFWVRAALVGAVLALGAGAAVVLLSGGDDGTQARRDAVAAYIVDINQTQQALIIELTSVSRAYRDLQLKERPVSGQLEKIEAAERTLRNLRTRLATLSTPGEARKLRAALLRLVDLQVELAHEVSGMVRYLPVQAAENRKFVGATIKLRDGLEGAKTGAEQQETFRIYRRAVLASAGRLERAAAPAVLEPSRTGEISRLERLAGLALQLGRALEGQQAEDVNRLFPRFVQTSASTGTTPAERKAVIAFNGKLRGITAQRSAVNAERAKLELELR